jgi:3-deoxy-7-phosphoheptulonate synthase
MSLIPKEFLPSPNELKHELPITPQQVEFIDNARSQIVQILNGEDPRILLIVGPCSIHDITAAKEYAIKLRQLIDRLSHTFFILMRVYFEKPRTVLGWKGLLYDPLLDGSYDIETGLHWTRQLLLDLAELQIPAASEFLDPLSPSYFDDLISWACIGARTAESQMHRQMASGLHMPVAFKNSTEGSIEGAVNGILAAASPHSFLGVEENGRLAVKHTLGNPHGHLVLRGGKRKPNYDAHSIAFALESLQKAHLPPRLLVDCSHDNANRNHEQQVHVFQSVMAQRTEGNISIRGVSLESNLYAGSQTLSGDALMLQYGVSLTDPCLDWTTTEQLILWGHDLLENRQPLLAHARFHI